MTERVASFSTATPLDTTGTTSMSAYLDPTDGTDDC